MLDDVKLLRLIIVSLSLFSFLSSFHTSAPAIPSRCFSCPIFDGAVRASIPMFQVVLSQFSFEFHVHPLLFFVASCHYVGWTYLFHGISESYLFITYYYALLL